MKRTAPLTMSLLLLAFTAGMALAPKEEAQKEPPTEPPVEMVTQTVKVELSDGTLRDMPMEEYVTGVLLAELPGSFAMETRKAQAVVSRTYAMRRLDSKKHASGAEVCVNTSCCQGWVDPDTYENQSLVDINRQAATDTSSLVLTYGGSLIDATFFSSSGGRTEAAVEVWGTDVPYLQPVDSPGEVSPHNSDTALFTPEEFSEKLGLQLTGPPETWLGDVTQTQGGGVAEMTIGGETFSGTELRKLLGLRSTVFTMEAGSDGITVISHGFGHRVGMSQYGAEAMALEGADFEEILLHYYTGAVVERRF